MAAWPDPPARPSLPRLAVGLALCVYLGAMLGLAALVLYRVLGPIVNLP